MEKTTSSVTVKEINIIWSNVRRGEGSSSISHVHESASATATTAATELKWYTITTISYKCTSSESEDENVVVDKNRLNQRYNRESSNSFFQYNIIICSCYILYFLMQIQFYIRIRRCCLIANPNTFGQSLNEVDISNRMVLKYESLQNLLRHLFFCGTYIHNKLKHKLITLFEQIFFVT